ncbi:MAG TPA: hypothetical protein VFT22_30245 [Kofleriaceae bacterium]|nr:hypothetical protein [Kofleriaceae bacterium]
MQAGLDGRDDVGDRHALGVEGLDEADQGAPGVVAHRDEALEARARRAGVVAVGERDDAARGEDARGRGEQALDGRSVRQVGQRVAQAEDGVPAIRRPGGGVPGGGASRGGREEVDEVRLVRDDGGRRRA